MIKRKDIILSIISGVLLVLSFPPFDLYPLAWTALVPLLVALQGKNSKTSFLLGLLTGFVCFVGTIYWVFHSMYFYGYIAAPISVLLLVLLCLYLALYTGMFSTLFNYSRPTGLPALFTVPVIWVATEFVRTYALTGFPWSLLGYSQYKFLSLIQVADITGIYGVSFLVAAANGVIFDIAVRRLPGMEKGPQSFGKTLAASVGIFAVIVACVLFYGSEKLSKDDSSGIPREKIRVSVVQGNIPQDKKWDIKFQREVIDTYKRLSLSTLKSSPDMIVWPETSVPFIFNSDKALTQDVISFQKESGAYLLFGSMVAKDADRLTNSAVLLAPDGEVSSIYDKIHLVPYGEYVPLRKFFPFIEKITVGIGDFLQGKEHTVMQTPFAKIGNLICYEIIFPGLVREFVVKGADVLVTITNDAWFGRTAAPYQHFSMSVFRAVENRVPVVRAANTGISGFIDSRGRIINKSDIFVEAVLTEGISAGNEKSLYTKYGDVFAWFCIACSLLLAAGRVFAGKRLL